MFKISNEESATEAALLSIYVSVSIQLRGILLSVYDPLRAK